MAAKVVAHRRAWRRSLISVAALAGLLALLAGAPLPSDAQGAELMAGGVAEDAGSDDIGDAGMPASNPLVRPLLAAHPADFVVICVAGCDGKPKIVQILPRPVTGRTAEYLPSAGTYGPARPGKPAGKLKTDSDAVVCMAGCDGRPGQIVQHIADLPPIAKSRPKPPATALPQAPEPKAPAPKGNEPLDVTP